MERDLESKYLLVRRRFLLALFLVIHLTDLSVDFAYHHSSHGFAIYRVCGVELWRAVPCALCSAGVMVPRAE